MKDDNSSLAVVVLAAGEGRRMKSDLPKVLHRACGMTLVGHVLEEVGTLAAAEVVVVVGHGAEAVRSEIGAGVTYALQREQLGTGDAVKAALEQMPPGPTEVLVLPGDSPLIRARTLEALVDARRKEHASGALLVTEMEDPTGYGRVIRGSDGDVLRIVEEADADDGERAVREVNACTYVFERGALERSLACLGADNAQGEYYLTAVVEPMVSVGETVVAVSGPAEEALGVNDRFQLAEAEALMRSRLLKEFALEGVTVVDPGATYIDRGVEIARDTVIMPLVFITGETRIGERCRVGPCTSVSDSLIGPGSVVEFSRVEGCSLEAGVQVGPYSRLRPGCRLGEGARVGSFVEIKNTVVGRGSKVPHLSYMGDAVIGEDVNVGAGSITCNYDGEEKHRTVIGDRAFIGSDTMLVAPVEIGEEAVTAAGSAIYRDVPSGSLGVERCEQKNVKGWKKKRGERGVRGRENPPSKE